MSIQIHDFVPICWKYLRNSHSWCAEIGKWKVSQQCFLTSFIVVFPIICLVLNIWKHSVLWNVVHVSRNSSHCAIIVSFTCLYGSGKETLEIYLCSTLQRLATNRFWKHPGNFQWCSLIYAIKISGDQEELLQ